MAFLVEKLKRCRISRICLKHPCSLCAPLIQVQGLPSLRVFDTRVRIQVSLPFCLPYLLQISVDLSSSHGSGSRKTENPSRDAPQGRGGECRMPWNLHPFGGPGNPVLLKRLAHGTVAVANQRVSPDLSLRGKTPKPPGAPPTSHTYARE